MRLIDADALIPTQVHTVVVLKDGREQLESVLYAEQVDDAPTVEPASPWRRVEEPPKIGVPVLVTFIGYNTGETKCDLLAAYDGLAWRYWDDEMLDEVIVEITHWMPLPDPPKEE